ncbi:MAG: hypothetical protein NC915_00505 [Candidatus Omnitrophica bacterium]|nr:hypothetical protein [Candidatus Omnitrophota bacterium]
MKNLIKYLLIFAIVFISNIFTNCSKKEEKNVLINEERIKKFSLKQFSQDFSITLNGESAEIAENKDVKISSPSFSLKTSSEIIEIKTDKGGKGEIKVDPDTQRIKEIIITGKVSILYKDKKEEKITMEISCGKLTYIDSKKEMIFEEKPLIKRGKNTFSGERIIYNIEKNTIEIKGNVNVEIYPEEKSGN